MRSVGLSFALALTLGLGLTACGGKDKEPSTTPTTGGGGGGKTATETAPASLYVRLGEKPAIEAVIDKFLANVEPQQGSWWPTWAQWLGTHSRKERVAPHRMGAARKGYKPLEAAPGSYVRQK